MIPDEVLSLALPHYLYTYKLGKICFYRKRIFLAIGTFKVVVDSKRTSSKDTMPH